MESTLSSRPRSSRTKKASAIVVPVSSTTPFNFLSRNNPARIVSIRLVFIHIGEIDTLNEKYQADIYYEAHWTERRVNVTSLNLTAQQQTQLLNENRSIKINELSSSVVWSPQLFIENAIAQIGTQEKWFTLKAQQCRTTDYYSSVYVDVNICEHRRVKGVFWEKLELNHFPADVQDLTISITSHHQVEDCILVQDERYRSSINREAFVDQQKWSLYEHVATEVRQTQEEYSFEVEDMSIETKKHPVLSVTCRAARRPGYYYWNAFYLIFLITVSAFCIFSIPPNLPQNRLQITCTLLLTSVTFRWVVNRSLPTVYYLTTLDIYAIISIMVLVVLCIWHSVIAAIIFHRPPEQISPSNTYVILDRNMMIGMMVFYFVLHILLLIWLMFVPYKRRREMDYLDRQYASRKHIQLNSSQSRFGSTQDLRIARSPFVHSDLSPIRPISSFFPAQDQDDSDESRRKSVDILQLQERESEFNHQNSDEHRSASVDQVERV